MKRTLFQIFIILFVVVSLFIVKDDAILVFKKIFSYLSDKRESIMVKLVEEEIKKEEPLSAQIETPGALKVNLNAILSNDAKLSKDNVILLTNKSRKENGGLTELKENSKLDLSAQKKLEDMFARQYFEHLSPDGVGVSTLEEEAGYEYLLVGENLAMGNFKDDKSLVDAWMASAGHRANILNKHYTEIGVAVGKGTFGGKSIWMAVTHFGAPKDVCPEVSQVLYGIIIAEQNTLDELDKELSTRKQMIDAGGPVYEGITYLEQIDEYNQLIIPYNNLIKDLKQKINKYNEQVVLFNACLVQNTN